MVIYETFNAVLREHGLMMSKDAVTDATIIAAHSSTKNPGKASDGEMHQTRKGSQWTTAKRARIGADADSGLVPSLTFTAGKVADVAQTEYLLHGEAAEMFADAGCRGADKRAALKDKPLKWHIAMKRGQLKAMAQGP